VRYQTTIALIADRSQGEKIMKLQQGQKIRGLLLLALIVSVTALSSNIKADTGNCGGVTITLPFNDVMSSPFFCQIAAAYFSGLTNGTGDGTTYSPTQTVTREQMAAFISRTMDQSLKRGSERAVAKKWFRPQNAASLTLTALSSSPQHVEFDGTDLWAVNLNGNVMRIRPGDSKILETWTGAASATCLVAAMGKIFITGQSSPGKLYMIDPTQAPGVITTLSSTLPNNTLGIAFDGSRIWTANRFGGSVSIISLNPTVVTNVSTGFTQPHGLIYDGANMWLVDTGANKLFKLNADGSIAQAINVGTLPTFPLFDGTNIWVPNYNSNSVTVVRVKDANGAPLANAFVLATLTGNGLENPLVAAFDGEQVLVSNPAHDIVSLWKASDLTPLGSLATGIDTHPSGICSDGLNFWITLQGANQLARF
jgi:hypothetical protein